MRILNDLIKILPELNNKQVLFIERMASMKAGGRKISGANFRELCEIHRTNYTHKLVRKVLYKHGRTLAVHNS